jgi:hypothetical protein
MQIIAAIVAAGLAISATIGPAPEGTVRHPDAPKPKPSATGPGSTGDISLNNDVARKNAEVDKRNAEAAADFAKKQAEYKQQQDAYNQAQKDYQRKLAEQKAAAQKYEQDKAAWAAKVAACKAGDVSQCAQ